MRRGLRSLIWPLVIAVAATFLYEGRIRRSMVDFGVYRVAAGRALAAEPLYREEDGHYKFKYLPAFAFAMTPFALVDVHVARALWYATTVGLLAAFLRWSIVVLPGRRRSMGLLAALTIVVMAKFYGHELTLGQSNILLGTMVVAALVALELQARVSAGLLLGLAVFVKPYAIILLPWAVVSCGAAAALASLGVIVAGLVAPALVYGWSGNLELLTEWYFTVTGSTASTLVGGDSVSVAAMWGKWLGVGVPATTLAAASGAALVGLAILMWAWRRRVESPAYLEVSMLLLLIPLLSPQGWDYVLLLGTPAVVCAIDRWSDLAVPWRVVVAASLAVMGLSIYDVMGRELYLEFMALSVVSVCGLTTAVSLAHLRWRALA